jgi:Flp pilus assembly pilin Flp
MKDADMQCTAAHIRGLVTRFLRDEQGAELVEWVLVTLAIGLAGYAALAGAREHASQLFDKAMQGLLDSISN